MAGKYIKRKLNKAKKWICERPYYMRRFVNRVIIRDKSFTIISNNCWAGKAYQYLGMQYLSPTVGLYFFADDYIKFVSDLYYYINLDLQFISAKQSKYYEQLSCRNHTNIPIGILDDIEIVFLHYSSEAEALEKWNRRKQRINWENIYIKFSYMNLCTERELSKFSELPFRNKFILTNRKQKKYSCEYYWNGPSKGYEILSDTNPYPGNLHLPFLLKRKATSYPKRGLSI